MSANRLIDAAGMRRTVTRLSHEVIEANRGAEHLAVIGIRTRGEFLARRVAKLVEEIEGQPVPVGILDITLYRDDLRGRLDQPLLQSTDIIFDVTGKTLILVDDVLYTGRTIRSALNAIMDLGRPKSIQLLVLIDRGHRELPIKADYVGKNVPTSVTQEVKVRMVEVDGEDAVYLSGEDEQGGRS
jgi:pyrimidine operon attenuation protein/uracil phosphoribosyltransferase